jgi:uncharacterized protein YjgD (DUF1641 family)
MSDEQHADTAGQDGETAADHHGEASGSEQPVPPELVTAVEDNPEEVARLVQNAGQVNDLLDASAVATAAIDDGMVQRLAADGSNLGAAADGAATPELAELGESVGDNADSLAEGVETVVELQESGTLDDLAAFADTIALLSAAMDDEMVTSLTSMGSRLGELADTASDEEVAQGLESMLHAVGDATSEDPEPVGAVGLVRALRDPEVRAGMGVAIALLRALGQGTTAGDQTHR